MPDTAIEVLNKYLMEQKINLSGVVGEVETVNFFKDLWLKENSLTFKLNMHLGIYEAREILTPQSNAEIILATQDYKSIVFKFVKGFIEDSFPHQKNEDAGVDKLSDRHINNKSLYLLKNGVGEIVSMAANTRGSLNGGTISLVYTPPEFRGKGYGSLVTALLSNVVLKEKKFANLFTDLNNPTSNSIYQKIGYKKIGENIHYNFKD